MIIKRKKLKKILMRRRKTILIKYKIKNMFPKK